MNTGTTALMPVAFVLLAARETSLAAAPDAGSVDAGGRQPACKVELDARSPAAGTPSGVVHVRVDGRQMALGPQVAWPQELRVYPSGADAVFVAYAGRDASGPRGSDTLWRVPCADGIHALDLASYKTRRLTRATLPFCKQNHVPARDVIETAVDRRTLAFERGCSYEFDWHAQDMLLVDADTPRMKVAPAPPPPFTSVAPDAAGGVWLSDGRCDDRPTYGRILFSSNRGDSWRKVQLTMPTAKPVRQVIADRSKPSVVLFFTFACGSGAHTDPGWIYLTEDGGKTLRPIAVPPGIPAKGGMPASEQDPLEAVTAPDGSVAHLIIYGDSEDVHGSALARWESRDGGRSWKTLAPVSAPPGDRAGAAVGEWEFTIRRDGLYRSRKGEALTRVYPRR